MQRFSKFIVFLLVILFVWVSCNNSNRLAKGGKDKNDSLSRYPYWIAMMDSPGVNYYKAVNAFEKYWEHRDRPTEDDGEGKDIYGKEKSDKEKESEEKRSVQYVYEYKQFLNWEQRNKNLVKPDSTIMTPEEIIIQWKKNQNDTLKR